MIKYEKFIILVKTRCELTSV